MIIAILEDNEDRKAAMRSCLADRLYPYEARFFDNSAGMIHFLDAHLNDVLVIGLDHDLELLPDSSGEWIDPGTGRDVANHLARIDPVCPVVIHSSNSQAAVAMEMVLEDGGWKTYRVLPFEDTNWIATEWIRAMRRAAMDMAVPASQNRKTPSTATKVTEPPSLSAPKDRLGTETA
jgi:hypothetical protein